MNCGRDPKRCNHVLGFELDQDEGYFDTYDGVPVTYAQRNVMGEKQDISVYYLKYKSKFLSDQLGNGFCCLFSYGEPFFFKEEIEGSR